ncbi:MAG: hypothetical protein D6808_07960 [Candidatus Dadabacteria bacterium]|nr:MAG: hypothetical protein D6808_07960 [Candidatus Dadabacteria bacterium]
MNRSLSSNCNIPLEERLSHLAFLLEKRLQEDEDCSFSYEDIAFQLSDIRVMIERLNKKRGTVENGFYLLQLLISLITLGIVTYCARLFVFSL